MHAKYLWRPEEGIRSPGSVVTGCKSPYRCRELSLDLLHEQQVLLTAEPSLHPPQLYVSRCNLVAGIPMAISILHIVSALKACIFMFLLKRDQRDPSFGISFFFSLFVCLLVGSVSALSLQENCSSVDS